MQAKILYHHVFEKAIVMNVLCIHSQWVLLTCFHCTKVWYRSALCVTFPHKKLIFSTLICLNVYFWQASSTTQVVAPSPNMTQMTSYVISKLWHGVGASRSRFGKYYPHAMQTMTRQVIHIHINTEQHRCLANSTCWHNGGSHHHFRITSLPCNRLEGFWL